MIDNKCSHAESLITDLSSSLSELMTCEDLHAILHLVLQAGNIMNQVRRFTL